MPQDRQASAAASGLRRTHLLTRIAIAALALAVLIMAAAITRQQYSATREQAEMRAQQTAHILATQYSWVLHAASQALRRIEAAATSVDATRPEPQDIAEAVGDLPAELQYSLYDAAGELILTSVPDPTRIQVPDRAYFAALSSGQETVISQIVTERLTGEQVFILARRIDVDGQFAGAGTIAIPVRQMEVFAETLSVGDGAILTLLHENGALLSRSPPAPAMDVSSSKVFDRLADAPSGTYAGVSPIDGVERIVGYYKLNEFPVVAIAGLSRNTLFAPLHQQLRRMLVLLVPLLVGLGLLLVRLWRLQDRDERRELALIEAQEHSDYLMKEIHHRVKNNLQTVISLVRLSKTPDDVKTALLGRVSAMVAVHQEIYSSDMRERVAMRPYLGGLAQNVSAAYGDHITLALDIAPVDLSADRALQVGLLVNELLSNAYKHAFADRDSGRLELTLADDGAGQLRLIVQDDGPGLPSEGAAENMGSRLIAAFTSQIDGQTTTRNQPGLRVEIVFPQEATTVADSVDY
ncbi:sensor histidine kinase [Actibacterium ureilyticum]|uniref:sensor histidine kinase n=1 Tax=Actibacterium ureilyticum TaxID=1590614 RepID=UPI000BAAE2EF|nr:histidine kinase dimerization/phosphoacceptor domain -containing protein [Actibacterium ureilyticum]